MASSQFEQYLECELLDPLLGFQAGWFHPRIVHCAILSPGLHHTVVGLGLGHTMASSALLPSSSNAPLT